eukprot:TRINITY_DN4081_c0_g1_i1.p1 TRINITY_DN4081_c0_g1~~TRINITY_DN4081_c0_g1_i1.p1  ORF type:complete len:176 (+),score=67.74 TRINITY_DN4081_c0_g1_i1:76-603(+)
MGTLPHTNTPLTANLFLNSSFDRRIMSKTTDNRAFRTVDVDLYNEDNYKEEFDNEVDTGSTDDNQINSLLNSNKNVEALKLFLSGTPLNNKDPAAKKSALDLAMRIMMAVKQSQIEEAVKDLDNDSRDVLMKFIYKGFEVPSKDSSANLLIWHEKIFNLNGVGSVVRVLTDKRKA